MILFLLNFGYHILPSSNLRFRLFNASNVFSRIAFNSMILRQMQATESPARKIIIGPFSRSKNNVVFINTTFDIIYLFCTKV